MNVASYFRPSHLRKFDAHDSEKMPVSQKLAVADPVQMVAPRGFGR
jgi:hypothetical protein